MTKLLIATPVRGGELMPEPVAMGYAESVRALQAMMSVDVIPPTLTYSVDNIRARNRIAAMFLRREGFAADATHLLWWDSDQWPENLRIVEEMLALDVDVVGAPYTGKRLPLRWVHQHLGDRTTDERGLLEVRWVGFGFTIVSRTCLEKMSGVARVYSDRLPGGAPPHKVADIFGLMFFRDNPESDDPTDELLLSEDNSFCERWRQLGGKVHIYTRAGIVVHAGQHGWSAREMGAP